MNFPTENCNFLPPKKKHFPAEKCIFLQENALSCRKMRFSGGTWQETARNCRGLQGSRIKNAGQLSQDLGLCGSGGPVGVYKKRSDFCHCEGHCRRNRRAVQKPKKSTQAMRPHPSFQQTELGCTRRGSYSAKGRVSAF